MSDFPGALASDGSLLIAANNLSSTLNGGISSGATAMTLASTVNFPLKGGVTIESEAILYTGNDTATSVLSGLTRGADSTTAAIHADGSSVFGHMQARHHNALKDEIIAIETNIASRLGNTTTGIVTPGPLTVNGTSVFNTTTTIQPLLNILETGTVNDPAILIGVSTTSQYKFGIDNSDSDKLKISVGAALGTNDSFIMTLAGEITKPLQPAFLVTNSNTQTDVTGDGTSYTVTWNNEIFDANADFASDTFTAPVTGKYYLQAQVFLRQLGVAHTTIVVRIVTSNRTYQQSFTGAAGVPSGMCVGLSVLADMDAADTAIVQIQVSGSTKTVDVDNSGNDSFFSGYLVA